MVPYTIFDQFILQGIDLETKDLRYLRVFFPIELPGVFWGRKTLYLINFLFWFLQDSMETIELFHCSYTFIILEVLKGKWRLEDIKWMCLLFFIMFLKWEIYLEKSALFHRLLWKDKACLSKVAIQVIWAADRRFLVIGQVSNVNHWKFWPTKEGSQDALACLGGVRWLWFAAIEQGCCAWEQVLVN